MARKARFRAVGYGRTSAKANAKEGKDSRPRQKKAITEYASRAKTKLEGYFHDVVSGVTETGDRKEFSAMLEYCATNKISTVMVEHSDRFARMLLVQENGLADLQAAGIELICTSMPALFVGNSAEQILFRQFFGIYNEYARNKIVQTFASGRAAALKKIAKNPHGRRNLKGNPKLTGPDPRFRGGMRGALKTILKAQLRSKGKINAAKASRELRDKRPEDWCGPDGGPEGGCSVNFDPYHN